MQSILTYFALILTSMILHSQNTIVVNMVGFDSNQGDVKIALYNDEEGFLKNPIKTMSSEIIDNKASVTFTEITDGVYAISCYHDEDANGKLNFFMGMYPTEDTGTSNNAPTKFGPPKWQDAKFEVKNGETTTVDITL